MAVLLQVSISYPMGDITTALTDKNPEMFYTSVVKFTLIALACAPLFALDNWSGRMVNLTWRTAMTKEFLGEYLQNGTFFHLSRHPQIDNPGQRILDDIQSFTFSVQSLVELIFRHIVQFMGYSYILISLE